MTNLTFKLRDAYHHMGAKSLIIAQSIDEKAGDFIHRYRGFLYTGAVLLIASTLIDHSYAITVDSLKEPMKGLKSEMFDGWMFGAKIVACVAGVGFTIFKQSLAPFGIGAGVGAGIHFWDKWIGNGDAALI